MTALAPLGKITGFEEGFSKSVTDAPGRFADILSNIFTVFTIFGGLAFTFWFIIGAFNWITAGDNAETLNKAKTQMSSALVGLIILIVAVPVAYILGEITGLKILNPELIIERFTVE